MQSFPKSIRVFVGLAVLGLLVQPLAACTGLTLKAKDGAVVFGRTMEWGTFDLRSRVVIIPRGFDLQSPTPDGKQGLAWKTKYGTVGIDAVEKNYLIDGMNEKGLSVNLFYHEGFAEYPKYEPAEAAKTLDVLAVCPFLLTTCATTEEARAALADVAVVGSIVKEISSVPPVHLIITDRSGKAFVLEFTQGIATIHDAPLGVITNGPNYDWHLNNLLNYINLDTPLPQRTAEDLNALKFGGGNRLFGLPGDLSSPSRFLRVASYAGTARETDDGKETMYEMFRILDNFNLSVGASAEGSGEFDQEGMRSSTIWTTAYDTKNLIMQYHTMHNRRVRQVDFKNLDFDAKDIIRLPLDREKSQDVEDLLAMKKGGEMVAGAWSEGEIDQTTEDAVAFVLSRMNTSEKLKRIVQVKKQIVSGMNYDITFELANNAVWNAVVYRNLSGEFSITKSPKLR